MKTRIFAALLVVLLAVPAFAQTGARCDRDCLKGHITKYLDAMIAHNPKALSVSPKLRFTEDTKVMQLGEGLWKEISKLRPYRQDFLDVREGVAASHVVVEEAGKPVMLALRLKVVNNQLTEVETMVTRNREEGAIFNIEALQQARPEMNVVPTAAQKNSRADLIRIAEFYPLGLKVGGSFAKVNAPFSDDAYRVENGQSMAGRGARGADTNIKTSSVVEHPDVTYRLAAVDEELGLVLFRLCFGNTGDRYGKGMELTTFEAFKVYGGEMHAVEAFIRIWPVGAPSGWDDLYEVKKPK